MSDAPTRDSAVAPMMVAMTREARCKECRHTIDQHLFDDDHDTSICRACNRNDKGGCSQWEDDGECGQIMEDDAGRPLGYRCNKPLGHDADPESNHYDDDLGAVWWTSHIDGGPK